METKDITKQIKKELKLLSKNTNFTVRMYYPQVRVGYTDGPTEQEIKEVIQNNITGKMSLNVTRYMSTETQMELRKELGFKDDDVYHCGKTNDVNNSLIVQNKFNERSF